MPIVSDDVIYSVVRQEHMAHSDFFLRYLEFADEPMPTELVLTCMAGDRPCREIRYRADEIKERFAYGKTEAARYRPSSRGRILGRSCGLENAFMHEYFSFFSSQAVNKLAIRANCGGRTVEKEIAILPYSSPNRYVFPLRGTVLVTDTYPSINSHRWCRNSEFAFDAGVFDETLEQPVIGGMPVFAACEGVVAEVFDGLEDTEERTDLELLERQYGEHARIDGNHVLIRHANNEYSLYAHLRGGSISVKDGEEVRAGQRIGDVGSSGSSYVPHLHFHIMLGGLTGPGIPVCFEGLKTILGEPCLLDDAVNLVRYEQ